MSAPRVYGFIWALPSFNPQPVRGAVETLSRMYGRTSVVSSADFGGVEFLSEV